MNKKFNGYSLLPFIAMAYLTLKILSILLFYKIVTVFSIKASAGTLVIPLWFLLGDVITEVYGYKVARKILYAAVLCQVFFAGFAYLFNELGTVQLGRDQLAYSEVISHLPRVALVSVFSIIIGGLINAGLIHIWKLKLDGRYFSLRSLGASSIGELFFTICAYVIGFSGVTSFEVIVKLIAFSYFVKICINPLMIMPISILTKKIKNCEKQIKQSFIADVIDSKEKSKSLRLTTNNLGESYFTKDFIPTTVIHQLGKYSKDLSARHAFFREMVAGSYMDWHNAPYKQYIFYLSGAVEVTASNGQQKIFTAGDILLVEDVFGKGHTTRILKSGSSIILTL